MKKITFVLCLLSIILNFYSCQSDLEDRLPTSDEFVTLQSSSEIRGGLGQDPFSKLGKGFNLASYSSYDRNGIAILDILDKRRMENFEPWDPFGNNPNYVSSLPPLPIIDYAEDTDGWSSVVWSEDITNLDEEKVFTIDMGPKYRDLEFTNKYSNSTQKNVKIHTYQSSKNKLFSKATYNLVNPSDFTSYLNPYFVVELKNLKARDLVSRYGTHLITSYKIGPYYDLRVSTVSSLFSKDETAAIIRSLILPFKQDTLSIKFSAELKKKLERYSKQTSISLRIGGSKYMPHTSLLNYKGDFSPAEIVPFDEGEWYRQIKYEDNVFMELNPDDKLICIPSLITDIPLKVKYMSGIIDMIRENKNAGKLTGSTRYMLCSATTYEPTKFNDKYVYISLPRFEDQKSCTIFIGETMQNPISNSLAVSGLRDEWSVSLNSKGIWNITQVKKDGSVVYLCNDYRVRSEKNTSAELAAWFFNPIVTEDFNTAWGSHYLFIQKKRVK